MPAEHQPPTIDYGRVRLRWCLAALIDLLRRWGIYLTVGVLVLGSSANGAIAAMSAMTAWSVLPLFRATQEPIWLAASMALAHSLVGAVVVWGLRPVLWSRAWSEAEDALPIASSQQQRSDTLVVVLALTPLFVAYAAGAAVWAGKSPPWLEGSWPLAIGELLLSMALSIAWGVAILRVMRRSSRAGSALRAGAMTVMRPQVKVSPVMALVVVPLIRGPATRAARLFVISVVALVLLVAALSRWPQHASWWLAGFAALAFILTTRLNVVVTTELTPLHDACAPLPLPAATLLRARRVVAMLPQLIAQLALLPAILFGPRSVRPWVLVAFMLAALLGAAIQVASSTNKDEDHEPDPATRVSAWLFTLVLLVCLASEVLRGD